MGSVANVRGVVRDVIAGISGWKVSRSAPGLFGRDTDNYAHQSFTVGAPETTPHPRDGRQRPAEGLLVTTPLEVEWMYRLRADAQGTDYDAALDAEQELVSAVKAISDTHVTVGIMRRRALPEGYVLGSFQLSILHRYDLQ